MLENGPVHFSESRDLRREGVAGGCWAAMGWVLGGQRRGGLIAALVAAVVTTRVGQDETVFVGVWIG